MTNTDTPLHRDLVDSDRISDSLEALLFRANAGDAEARYTIGRWFETGEFIAPDPEEAVRWYRQAIDGG